VSAGNGTPDLAGLLSGRRADPMAYRRVFRDRWAGFLRANFHNPLHVAVFFSVDEATARKWWWHVNEPSGWAVAYARQTIPGADAALRMAA
jgi:hypothetical protein